MKRVGMLTSGGRLPGVKCSNARCRQVPLQQQGAVRVLRVFKRIQGTHQQQFPDADARASPGFSPEAAPFSVLPVCRLKRFG